MNRCVVKYLYDLYSQFSFNMLGFLVEVLEKGPSTIQSPVLTIIHCLLHYVDMTSATQTINSDLLRTVAKFVEVIIVLNQIQGIKIPVKLTNISDFKPFIHFTIHFSPNTGKKL